MGGTTKWGYYYYYSKDGWSWQVLFSTMNIFWHPNLDMINFRPPCECSCCWTITRIVINMYVVCQKLFGKFQKPSIHYKLCCARGAKLQGLNYKFVSARICFIKQQEFNNSIGLKYNQMNLRAFKAADHKTNVQTMQSLLGARWINYLLHQLGRSANEVVEHGDEQQKRYKTDAQKGVVVLHAGIRFSPPPPREICSKRYSRHMLLTVGSKATGRGSGRVFIHPSICLGNQMQSPHSVQFCGEQQRQRCTAWRDDVLVEGTHQDVQRLHLVKYFRTAILNVIVRWPKCM